MVEYLHKNFDLSSGVAEVTDIPLELDTDYRARFRLYSIKYNLFYTLNAAADTQYFCYLMLKKPDGTILHQHNTSYRYSKVNQNDYIVFRDQALFYGLEVPYYLNLYHAIAPAAVLNLAGVLQIVYLRCK